ncbi:MAG TPA: S24/S26 family peptidase [Desulfitobacteriaceae bacterium]|nr:S24/S26 family peptidase [Desulfitobacteriaceae bacterium]
MYKELNEIFIPASDWVEMILPLLNKGYELKISPNGTSMLPFICGGRDEAVLIARTDIRLKRGDVVLYSREDKTYVLHRIHHIKAGRIYMLGDIQTWIEGPIEDENVVAVVKAFVRKGKYISCHNFIYKLVTGLWLVLRPVRPFLWKHYCLIKKRLGG